MYMKERIAYLRGLMDGLKLEENDNTKVLRAIAECLDSMANEIEAESARVDDIEEQIDSINDDIDEMDEVLGFLIDEEEDEEDEDDDEDWEDDFDFFTCPNCGEVVPLTDDVEDPICPKCNSKLFDNK